MEPMGKSAPVDDFRWRTYCPRPAAIQAVRMTAPFEVAGKMQGEAGDWLIEAAEGELHVCEDSVFREAYELAEEKEKGNGALALQVSGRLLAKMLGFPDGSSVTGMELNTLTRVFIIRVDGNGLPKCLEGAQPRPVAPEDIPEYSR